MHVHLVQPDRTEVEEDLLLIQERILTARQDQHPDRMTGMADLTRVDVQVPKVHVAIQEDHRQVKVIMYTIHVHVLLLPAIILRKIAEVAIQRHVLQEAVEQLTVHQQEVSRITVLHLAAITVILRQPENRIALLQELIAHQVHLQEVTVRHLAVAAEEVQVVRLQEVQDKFYLKSNSK